VNLRTRLRIWFYGCDVELFDDFYVHRVGVVDRFYLWWKRASMWVDCHAGRFTTILTALFALVIAVLGAAMHTTGGYILTGAFTCLFLASGFVLIAYWDEL